MKSYNCPNILLFGVVACNLLLAGCDSPQDKAAEAFGEHQAALAAGDLHGSLRALSAVVAADDSQADYWIELGKVQAQLSDLGGAYNSFMRARELDRANPMVLAFLTQLQLRSGNLPLAEETARDLELVAPDDPAVRLTYGYVALRRGDLEEARKHSSSLLSDLPNDSSAKVLHARVLLRSGKPDEAVTLLREQIRLQPSDQASLRAIGSIYEVREQWQDAAWAAGALLEWRPEDAEVRARFIENALRSGRTDAARASMVAGMKDAPPHVIAGLLAPWSRIGAQRQVADAVFELGKIASGDRQIAFARFLAEADQPARVVELTRQSATLPVTASNLAANALYGAALARTGRASDGLSRLDAVFALDAVNADALRGRADVRSRAGMHKLAIEDAEKAVAVDRTSAQTRLLLARIQRSAGDLDGAKRTLWNAFHDLPGERSIYEALRALVLRSEGMLAVQRLAKEFDDQRNNELMRSFA